MRRFAISDIHGHPKTLEALLDRIQLSPSDRLFLLGDYINKGPDSKGALDLILRLKARGYQLVCLKGNHEEIAVRKNHVGPVTIRSFGVRRFREAPLLYREFMQDLPLLYCEEEYILVHGGLDFTHARPLEANNQMMYLRQWQHQIKPEVLAGRVILYGHTPNMRDNMLRQLERLNDNLHLCLDNGCFLNHQMGFGGMAAFDMDKRELVFQQNVD